MFRPDPKLPVREKKKKKRMFRKATGELNLFREIWFSQKHVCENCGKFLPEFSHSLFHHRKPKGRYPELRLVKDNIMILCFECHHNEHFGIKKK